MSAILVALLAASPLVAAEHAIFRRQATTTSSAASPLDSDAVIGSCFIPTSLATPTGAPTVPADVSSFLATATITDDCDLFGTGVPASISSEVSSYTVAVSSWVSANINTLQSYVSAVQSFQSSQATGSQCSSYYSASNNNPYIITGTSLSASDFFDDFGTCTAGAGGAGTTGALSTAPASNSAASSSAAATNSAGSTTALVSSASSPAGSAAAASSSTGSAAITGHRASSAPAFLAYIGATFAATAFIGMIAL